MGSQKTLEGILHFFSETGTEGGLWALQENKYITPKTTRYSCVKCHLYWDKNRNKKVPVYEGDYCSPKDHEFELVCKNDWDYKGLNILEDGDELTIHHPETKEEVWHGIIELTHYDPFTQHIHGLWMHADQKGIDRETWAEYFFKEYPAELRKQKRKVL